MFDVRIEKALGAAAANVNLQGQKKNMNVRIARASDDDKREIAKINSGEITD